MRIPLLALLAAFLLPVLHAHPIPEMDANPAFHPEFLQWKGKHKVTYANAAVEARRHKNWHAKHTLIEAHNADPSKTFKMAHNQFSDLTVEEFAQRYLTPMEGLKLSEHHRRNDKLHPRSVKKAKGKVTKHKKQGKQTGLLNDGKKQTSHTSTVIPKVFAAAATPHSSSPATLIPASKGALLATGLLDIVPATTTTPPKALSQQNVADQNENNLTSNFSWTWITSESSTSMVSAAAISTEISSTSSLVINNLVTDSSTLTNESAYSTSDELLSDRSVASGNISPAMSTTSITTSTSSTDPTSTSSSTSTSTSSTTDNSSLFATITIASETASSSTSITLTTSTSVTTFSTSTTVTSTSTSTSTTSTATTSTSSTSTSTSTSLTSTSTSTSTTSTNTTSTSTTSTNTTSTNTTSTSTTSTSTTSTATTSTSSTSTSTSTSLTSTSTSTSTTSTSTTSTSTTSTATTSTSSTSTSTSTSLTSTSTSTSTTSTSTTSTSTTSTGTTSTTSTSTSTSTSLTSTSTGTTSTSTTSTSSTSTLTSRTSTTSTSTSTNTTSSSTSTTETLTSTSTTTTATSTSTSTSSTSTSSSTSSSSSTTTKSTTPNTSTSSKTSTTTSTSSSTSKTSMMTNVLQRAATVASVCFNQWLAGTPYPTGSSVSYNGFNYNNSLLVLPSDGAPGSGSGNGKWNMQGACITAVTSNVPATTTTTTTTSTRTTSSTSIPTRASLNSQSVDWVAKGYVTSIKSQANYGACVVFTTIELMEAYYYGQTKNLTSFSEQQVFDCFPAFSSDFNGCGQHKVGSCGGTNPSYGFQTLNILRNLQTYDQNPWLGAQGGCIDNRDTGFDNCPLPNAPTGVCAAGGGWNFASVSYTGGTGETWMSFDVMSGPVGATINCACASWMHYHSGILTADACGKMSGVNHAVSVVGYNWNEGAPYWIVKNHWDTTWGMQGYAWVAAGYNAFNIASYSYLQIASVS